MIDTALLSDNPHLSFAEFYMQIEEKYKKDYIEALKLFRAERTRYAAELSKVSGLRVLPSQANYVMAEITNGMTAAEVTRILIVKHGILIKSENDYFESSPFLYRANSSRRRWISASLSAFCCFNCFSYCLFNLSII